MITIRTYRDLRKICFCRITAVRRKHSGMIEARCQGITRRIYLPVTQVLNWLSTGERT